MTIARKRILVVDDNETNLKLFEVLLSRDYDSRSAKTAREGLALVSSFQPDLLLLDVQLPDMDGLALTRLLRADPKTEDLLIVAVTAYAMKGDAEKALDAGVDGYLTKPIDKDLFRRTVADFLSKGGTNVPTKRGSHEGSRTTNR